MSTSAADLHRLDLCHTRHTRKKQKSTFVFIFGLFTLFLQVLIITTQLLWLVTLTPMGVSQLIALFPYYVYLMRI
ncbi:MAG: hypothetical protein FWC74_10450 [Candidatus Bathyarchaeota archaeon]|nr:hypothetical protein [Candidatus Termitimicrobium sp.]